MGITLPIFSLYGKISLDKYMEGYLVKEKDLCLPEVRKSGGALSHA